MEYSAEHMQHWDEAISLMQKSVPSPVFNAWFKTLKLRAVKGNTIICETNDPMALDSIRKRWHSTLNGALDRAFGYECELVLGMHDEIERRIEQLSSPMLNRDCTFDNFVVGASNSFAYSASLAVAEDPNGSYNPLFIYGGVGLGKTHLMNAIGNYISENMPEKNVLFISSETFTNEFINSLNRRGNMNDLRDKMRTADVFMVDDIQFLSKTVATQEEFFHTFNDLHKSGKQIILSSDRPPREIPTIEERLRSRFEWGLTVDIRKPDFETRVAILRRKCEDEMITCAPEVLDYIAQRVDTNIRVLEGALNRLRAKSELIGGRITLEFAMDTLEAVLPQKKSNEITPELILSAVAERYAVTTDDMISKKRNREFTLPRQIAMHLLREMTQLSTTAIGNELGGRDHTTVMHGCERIEKSMKDDPTFRRSIDELKEAIKGT